MVNSNRMTESRKKIEKLNDKYKKGYLYKKWIFRISVALIAFIGIFNFVNVFKKDNLDFDENNIASLNSKKFSREIVSLYERDGEDNKFIDSMKNLESSIAIYLIENTTEENNSFENLVKDAEKKLNSDDWSFISKGRNLYYNGKYILDEKGNLSFKFDKNVEPVWAKSLSKFIVLN